MKKVCVGIFALAVIGSASAGDKIPNLKGDWIAQSEASVYGAGGLHPGDTSNPTFRTHNLEIHFIVDGQQGRSFNGRLVAATGTQKMVGSIAQDGRTGVMASEDGVFQFTMNGKNSLVYCFAQTKPNFLVAACNSAVKSENPTR